MDDVEKYLKPKDLERLDIKVKLDRFRSHDCPISLEDLVEDYGKDACIEITYDYFKEDCWFDITISREESDEEYSKRLTELINKRKRYEKANERRKKAKIDSQYAEFLKAKEVIRKLGKKFETE